jgi:hypothetical protein
VPCESIRRAPPKESSPVPAPNGSPPFMDVRGGCTCGRVCAPMKVIEGANA